MIYLSCQCCVGDKLVYDGSSLFDSPSFGEAQPAASFWNESKSGGGYVESSIFGAQRVFLPSLRDRPVVGGG
jgi:hypothetical protein